jgi:small glutamine-rich tetratricopeptide repeat-containing protein alpha
MNNPAIAQMAQQFMSDPNMMNNLGAMFGGMGGGLGAPAAAAAPAPAPVAESKPKEAKAKAASNPMDQLTQLINSPEGQEMMLDPVLGPVMVDIQANGPMAAMKHIGNPAVMQKIQALMAKKK